MERGGIAPCVKEWRRCFVLTDEELRRKYLYLDDETVRNLENMPLERKRKGITRKELSAQTGIPQSCLMTYEHGTGYPTLGNYEKLAEFFGWDIKGSANYIFSHRKLAVRQCRAMRARKALAGWDYEELGHEVNVSRQVVQATCKMTRQGTARTFGKLMEVFAEDRRRERMMRQVK